MGTTDDSPSSLGNLGEGYSAPFNQFSIQDTTTSSVNTLPLPDPLMQYIGLVSSNYFNNANSVHVEGSTSKQTQFIDLYSTLNAQKNNLQLYTFLLKPSLAPVRQSQQSNPVVGIPPSHGGSGVTPPSAGSPVGIPSPKMSDEELQEKLKAEGKPICSDLYRHREAERLGLWLESPHNKHKYYNKWATGGYETTRRGVECYDSPLYLYGTTGQTVKVNINTYVYNTELLYNDGYDVTLLTDGKMLVNGTVTERIKYDYIPAIKKITSPTYGRVTTREHLGSVLKEYAQNLGLNKKETEDLIAYGEENVRASYVFVSFFNQNKSEEILPLNFSPRPDNYLNVVFYFKQYAANPFFKPKEPVFPTRLNRSGFTAVEVSGLVE